MVRYRTWTLKGGSELILFCVALSSMSRLRCQQRVMEFFMSLLPWCMFILEVKQGLIDVLAVYRRFCRMVLMICLWSVSRVCR